MRVQTLLPVTWRGNPKVSADPVRAPGKSSDSTSFARDDGTPSRETPRQRPRLQVELVSQDATPAYDPFRDGPRLNAAFVTQLLGQALEGERHVAPRIVYGQSAADTALILDTRL